MASLDRDMRILLSEILGENIIESTLEMCRFPSFPNYNGLTVEDGIVYFKSFEQASNRCKKLFSTIADLMKE